PVVAGGRGFVRSHPRRPRHAGRLEAGAATPCRVSRGPERSWTYHSVHASPTPLPLGLVAAGLRQPGPWPAGHVAAGPADGPLRAAVRVRGRARIGALAPPVAGRSA